MNKLAKTIIGVLAGIIVILIVVIILLASHKSNENTDTTDNNNNYDEIKELIGVYLYTNTTNNRDNRKIELNKDMTCYFRYDFNECKWTKTDNTINFHLARYKIVYDSGTFKNSNDIIANINDPSNTKEICEEKIQKYNNMYNLVNPRCEYEQDKTPIKATIVNNGLLIDTTMYNKIG